MSSGTLTIDPGSVSNSGVLEASGGATLAVTSATVTNSGGTVEAQAGASMQVSDTTITGGLLKIDSAVTNTTVFVPGNASGEFGTADENNPLISAFTDLGAGPITVSVNATGTVFDNPNPPGSYSPNGYPFDFGGTTSPLAEAGDAVHADLLNSLIGAFVPKSTVASSGFEALDNSKYSPGIPASDLFYIGSSDTFTVSGPGTLYLGINDTYVGDNSGGYSVTVNSTAVATLTLAGATIDGTAITNNGDIVVSGSSTIEGNATLSGGGVTIASGQTLTLDNVTASNVAVLDNGSLATNSGHTVTLAGTDAITGIPIILNSYNAVNDFSITSGNPNGLWSYLAAGTPLSLTGDNPQGILYWWNGGALPNYASINENISGSIIPVDFRPDHLNLDPQSLANVMVRFTAPTAGTYVITGDFLATDEGAEHTHAVQILDDGTAVLSGSISSTDQDIPFSLTETLNAGDTIDFVVDTGSGGDFSYLGTGLSATVTELGAGGSELNNAGTINVTGTTSSDVGISQQRWWGAASRRHSKSRFGGPERRNRQCYGSSRRYGNEHDQRRDGDHRGHRQFGSYEWDAHDRSERRDECRHA